MGAVQ